MFRYILITVNTFNLNTVIWHNHCMNNFSCSLINNDGVDDQFSQWRGEIQSSTRPFQRSICHLDQCGSQCVIFQRVNTARHHSAQACRSISSTRLATKGQGFSSCLHHSKKFLIFYPQELRKHFFLNSTWSSAVNAANLTETCPCFCWIDVMTLHAASQTGSDCNAERFCGVCHIFDSSSCRVRRVH